MSEKKMRVKRTCGEKLRIVLTCLQPGVGYPGEWAVAGTPAEARTLPEAVL
jgi:hypothetical protein